MDHIVNDQSMDMEHDHLESEDIEALLPTPISELNSTIPSLELTAEAASEIPTNNDDVVKEPEMHEVSGMNGLDHKQDGCARESEKLIEIWEPDQNDVLTGRGANINLHPGNQKFRALCYAHKAIFDVANHAAKRRIATEIWTTCQKLYNSRFLSKRSNNPNGPWIQQHTEKAILKAAQTIRDYQRPDRILHRQSLKRNNKVNSEDNNHKDTNCGPENNGNKKRRIVKSATPMDHVVIPQPPQEPVYENPDGVEKNDVLCGRGAFVNGHYGNKYLRELAMTRKCAFDTGNYTDKRKLATEIVDMIQQLQPPGRFLTLNTTKPTTTNTNGGDSLSPVAESHWEEVGLDKAIMKACQVMRDIDRPDRKYRVDRKLARLNRLQALNIVLLPNETNTSCNDDKQNVVDNCNEQNNIIGTADNDDAIQPRPQKELEPLEQENGSDRSDIDAIIIDVVDHLATSVEGARDHT